MVSDTQTDWGLCRTSRCFGVLLAALLWVYPSALQAQFSYATNEGTITITGYTGPGGAVVIPDRINDLLVTSIGSAAFYQHSDVTSVIIPNTVTNIGTDAFWFCSGLTNVTMSTNLITLGTRGFASGNFSSILLPGSLTSIGIQAFSGCGSLKTATIPNAVTNIGNAPFQGCGSLTGIEVDASNAFFSSVDGVLFDKPRSVLLQFPGARTGSYAMPSGVENIADWAFAQCSYLAAVTISGSVTNLGLSAFRYCYGLTNVAIPASVRVIGANAFQYCSNLAAIAIPNSVTNLGGAVFDSCPSLAVANIGIGVTNLPSGAFNACTVLGGVSLPDGLLSIGPSVFANCRRLTNIALPISVKSIGTSAFSGCTNLTNFTLGHNVTSLGSSVFNACSGLQTVTVGSGIASLPSRVFYLCSKLTAVYFMSHCPTADSSAFTGSSPTIYYLAGKTGWGPNFAGRPTALWDPATQFSYSTNSSFATITAYLGTDSSVAIPPFLEGKPVTVIGPRAFDSQNKLTTVIIPGSVTNIGAYAFNSCAGLAALYFQSNAPVVNVYYSFYNDTKAILYYLPGTTGWGSTFAGRPAVLWNPHFHFDGRPLGLGSNEFGFTVAGTESIPLAVEAATNLDNSDWCLLQTCNLTNGSLRISDPDWTNYPARFYRIRSP